MIYLDYAATTPVDPRVLGKMMAYMTQEGQYGNPASLTHAYGKAAQQAVMIARQQVADAIAAQAHDIIFTSGATEANNLAIKGYAEFHQRRGKHIITAKTEHKAVLDTCRYLQQQGFEITYLDPQDNGLIDVQQLTQAIRPETILLSLMLVNNETGVLQDIATISQVAHANGVQMHVDAAQAIGKLDIDVNALGVDLLSISAHKAYGPKGIGALYVSSNPRIRLNPQIHGGGQENSLRAGTLATQQIVGMGEALQIAQAEQATESQRIRELQNRFWQGLQTLGHVYINGDKARRVPHIINISFAGVDSGALLVLLPQLALSTGSACSSGSIEPSHVLQAMRIDKALSQSALRFSFGRFTTQADIEQALQQIIPAVQRLRLISPYYQS